MVLGQADTGTFIKPRRKKYRFCDKNAVFYPQKRVFFDGLLTVLFAIPAGAADRKTTRTA
jgi:hypothetical protein